MTERYPGYDVLDKRGTLSWNAKTREVIARRLAVHRGPRFLSPERFTTLKALCDRIVPQDEGPGRVPLEAYVDERLHLDKRAGYRNAALPPIREAWTRGLDALEAEAKTAYARSFTELDAPAQDALVARMSTGELHEAAWGDMACRLFFVERVLAEIPLAYYAHPNAWSELGFGGPASPRGYVRTDFDRRDPWEAVEATPGREDEARRANARLGR